MSKLQELGLNYINGRNAIIGIAGRLDASRFRDYVTLVPLKTDIMDSDNPKWHLDRLVEIEFLNKYFAREVNLKYSIIQGDYVSILYQVNKYMQEAEYMRQFIPFMYDGIVVSYYGEEIRQELGRKNFINKYSMAIKFNPMAVDTVFLGYKYTIGMNGVITPMIYYRPVEFYGAIHDHSSGHSYARFQELALKPGDIIRVTYTNDVMPYVDKLDIEANRSNQNHPVMFITHCPVCGCEISISQSQKQAICPNPNCHGRKVALMTNMVSKLGFVGFSTEYITDII
jgi:NAD-dependent DNA ligase